MSVPALLAVAALAAPFTLNEGGANRPWSLTSALGRERVLIVRNPPAAYLNDLRAQDTALQVRDLRVVALLPPGDPRLTGPRTLMLTVLADPGGTVGAQYGPAALIGKDRHIKARYPGPPRLETVGALIDTMPMRQQERRERGR
ncbi:hypothetical protein HNQ07_003726 [Deinococcus metalli]|uniref:DUF4174 domain-containing protein n=1 Tax=Deinococcus metalli TaxID=1141878 RepID=A0A7W8KHX9_9DEIO|nr:DUF4174 domain-containing protein [Deinococcus metalli]MBB5378225.1 hypothetical protein [Deinococcus metalli]GHF56967.1 hypothetical protein GCM10017781_36640 [Deinococcus metalli]